MKKIRPLAAGNWKMNGAGRGEIATLARRLKTAKPACDVLICPPAPLLASFAATKGMDFGGQDCHAEASGAYTGDISAEMLKAAGASAVILGHSERRAGHDESDAQVMAKVRAAHRAGLVAIVCVGETLAQRRGGQALRKVGTQLRGSLPPRCTSQNTVIAYEPVWAIGSGRIPSSEEIAAMHGHIRKVLTKRFGKQAATMRILYGGSVKPDNAKDIAAIENVNGVLVGGASLKAKDFFPIIAACGQIG